MSEDNGWFGRRGIASLAQAQQQSVGGISAVTRTCIAAYKQFDDIEWLLPLAACGLTEKDAAAFAQIKKRHEKYRAMQETEVIPERA